MTHVVLATLKILIRLIARMCSSQNAQGQGYDFLSSRLRTVLEDPILDWLKLGTNNSAIQLTSIAAQNITLLTVQMSTDSCDCQAVKGARCRQPCHRCRHHRVAISDTDHRDGCRCLRVVVLYGVVVRKAGLFPRYRQRIFRTVDVLEISGCRWN